MEPARLRITHTADSSMNSDTCGGTETRSDEEEDHTTHVMEGRECAGFYSSVCMTGDFPNKHTFNLGGGSEVTWIFNLDGNVMPFMSWQDQPPPNVL